MTLKTQIKPNFLATSFRFGPFELAFICDLTEYKISLEAGFDKEQKMLYAVISFGPLRAGLNYSYGG